MVWLSSLTWSISGRILGSRPRYLHCGPLGMPLNLLLGIQNFALKLPLICAISHLFGPLSRLVHSHSKSTVWDLLLALRMMLVVSITIYCGQMICLLIWFLMLQITVNVCLGCRADKTLTRYRLRFDNALAGLREIMWIWIWMCIWVILVWRQILLTFRTVLLSSLVVTSFYTSSSSTFHTSTFGRFTPLTTWWLFTPHSSRLLLIFAFFGLN